MKVVILGKTGMLGRYVYTYLKDKFDVIGTSRDTFNVISFNITNIGYLPYSLDTIGVERDDVIINCIGVIKQKQGASKLDFIYTNTLFPLLMQESCIERGVHFIHVTTDCVFNGLTDYKGKTGYYDEDYPHNAADVYGMTKSLGEPHNATVIRTSIIGEELQGKLSLLEWVKSNKNKKVYGFTNHYWNGITCLQFAILCEYIIKNNSFWSGVKHVFSPNIVSKFELVNLISYTFKLNVEVEKQLADSFCDRTLKTSRPSIGIDIPNLSKQIEDLKEYSENLLKL